MAKKITEDGEVIDTVTDEIIAMAPPFWKTQWNHDRDHESLAHGLTCKDPTKTQQHLAKETELAEILRKFQQTGEAPGAVTAPRYMDIEREFDLQSEIVTGHQVEEAWNALPAAVRNILKDPQTFVNYVDHCLERGDLEPLRELGLAKAATPPPEPPKARQEPPKPPTPPTGGTPAPDGGKAASEAAT